MFADVNTTPSGALRCVGPYFPVDQNPHDAIVLMASFVEEIESMYMDSFVVWGTLEHSDVSPIKIELAEQAIPWSPMVSVRSQTVLSKKLYRLLQQEWSSDLETGSWRHRSGFEVVTTNFGCIVSPCPNVDAELFGKDGFFLDGPHNHSIYSFVSKPVLRHLSAKRLADPIDSAWLSASPQG